MPGREVRNFSGNGMAAEEFPSDSARRKLAVSFGSHCTESQWHPVGESNPSFQVENLTS